MLNVIWRLHYYYQSLLTKDSNKYWRLKSWKYEGVNHSNVFVEATNTSPFKVLWASSASLLSPNVMKANPLDLPVSLSVMHLQSVMVPNFWKASLRSSSVVYNHNSIFFTHYESMLTFNTYFKTLILNASQRLCHYSYEHGSLHSKLSTLKFTSINKTTTESSY